MVVARVRAEDVRDDVDLIRGRQALRVRVADDVLPLMEQQAVGLVWVRMGTGNKCKAEQGWSRHGLEGAQRSRYVDENQTDHNKPCTALLQTAHTQQQALAHNWHSFAESNTLLQSKKETKVMVSVELGKDSHYPQQPHTQGRQRGLPSYPASRRCP